MKATTTRQSDGDLQDAALLGRQLKITTEAGIEVVVQRYFGNQPRCGRRVVFRTHH